MLKIKNYYWWIVASFRYFIYFSLKLKVESKEKVFIVLKTNKGYEIFNFNVINNFVNTSKLKYGIVRVKNMHTLKSKEKLLSDFDSFELNTIHANFAHLQNWHILNKDEAKLHALLLSQHNYITNDIKNEFLNNRVYFFIRIGVDAINLREFIEAKINKELEEFGLTNYVLKIVTQEFDSFLDINSFSPYHMKIPFLQFLEKNYSLIDLDECNIIYLLTIYHRPLLK